MNKKILLASDCFSENRNATLIAKQLQKIANYKPENFLAASLVSEGREYGDIPVITDATLPPSGGFATQSIGGFFADLFSGSLGIPFNFVKKIKNIADEIGLALVVGDVFLLWLVNRALKNKNIPILFYVHSKTDYIEPHYRIEERIIKNIASDVFTRDELTAESMRNKEIPAQFLGSVIMDELFPEEFEIPLDKSLQTVGILPGTRGEALDNFILILKVVEKLSEKRKLNFPAAMVGSLSDDKISEKCSKYGWKFIKSEHCNYIEKNSARVLIVRRAFVNTVISSDILIGLTGAANEQAVGLGKPVLAFKGIGAQTTTKRFKEQERLLGGAMKFLKNDPDAVAEYALKLLDNPEERERMGKIGMERMGPPGGAERIAKYIYEKYLKNQ
ncbi:MAG: hypothetical protein D6707_06245 [Bacteroidetes bacterium]|nr:MAG: hypothetical protein D6707_06245 [Bacteroidota bacterium]